MSKFIRLMLLGLVAISSSLFAADKSAVDKNAGDQIASQLLQRLDAMNTLEGKFAQTTRDAKGEVLEQEQSSGDFMMKRPGMFYWKTLEPMPQLLVSNNKMIWLYDPDLGTVNQRAFSDDLRETPALLLSASIDQLRKNFSVTRSDKNGAEQYSLTPKVTEGLFQQLTLVFKGADLSEFVIQDSLGQVTSVVLSDVKRNQPVAEEKFFFIPPQGVEIIKN